MTKETPRNRRTAEEPTLPVTGLSWKSLVAVAAAVMIFGGMFVMSGREDE
jgi:hypothetical protein